MSMQKSGDTDSSICGATNRNDEPCQLPAGWGTPGSGGERCKFHGGGSSGPKDTGHLEGNDYAEDNPGGGAPVGNDNSATHNGWADPDKFYERLEREQKEYVDKLTECYVEESKADLPEEEIQKKARRLAMCHMQWQSTTLDTFKRGWVLEEEIEYEGETYTKRKINPAFKAERRVRSKDMKLMRELRAYGTSDGLPYPKSVDSS